MDKVVRIFNFLISSIMSGAIILTLLDIVKTLLF